MEARVANSHDVLGLKIEEWRARAFAWGTSDCWQFPADVVLALTGVDYRERFSAYTSESEAADILAAYGGMVGLASSVLGKPKPVAWAHRGDVVVAELVNGPTAGICLGLSSCALGPRGLVFFRTSMALAAWTI